MWAGEAQAAGGRGPRFKPLRTAGRACGEVGLVEFDQNVGELESWRGNWRESANGGSAIQAWECSCLLLQSELADGGDERAYDVYAA